ncbi:hypothetical protein B0H10DRAFT_1949094 [Mycena sp. CBHHK59/15]|nr:hypothetical protein B0H10DRAFT_1949094 [Mycena sp. CBHHK59/15]
MPIFASLSCISFLPQLERLEVLYWKYGPDPDKPPQEYYDHLVDGLSMRWNPPNAELSQLIHFKFGTKHPLPAEGPTREEFVRRLKALLTEGMEVCIENGEWGWSWLNALQPPVMIISPPAERASPRHSQSAALVGTNVGEASRLDSALENLTAPRSPRRLCGQPGSPSPRRRGLAGMRGSTAARETAPELLALGAPHAPSLHSPLSLHFLLYVPWVIIMFSGWPLCPLRCCAGQRCWDSES